MTTSCRTVRRFAGFLLATGALVAGPIGAGDAGAGTRPARSVDDPAVTSGLAWHLEAVGAPVAWRSSLGAGITVAVVDSAVDAGHPDLNGQVIESVSCVGADGDPGRCRAVASSSGPSGDAHGTHVAGILAARADDGIGSAGVAPRARLLAVQTLVPDCAETGCLPVGTTADVAAGVRWSVAHGAQVINLSLTAGHRLGSELASALEEAWAAGATPVLSAGNRGSVTEFRESPRAIMVTATTRSGSRAPYGPDVDRSPLGVAAPGGTEGDTAATCRVGATPGGLVSTSSRAGGDGSGYACLAGTSMAAPQVSGGLALLLSMGFTRDQAIDRLLGTARPGPGLGAGEIDLAAATSPPLPAGVRARTDRFATAAPSPEVQAASTGPFASPRRAPGRRVPSWQLMLLGGLAAALAADLVYRVTTRRRAQAAQAEPPSDHPG